MQVVGNDLHVSGVLFDAVDPDCGPFNRVADMADLVSDEPTAENSRLWDQMADLAVWIHHVRYNGTALYDSVPQTAHRVIRGPTTPSPTSEERESFFLMYRLFDTAVHDVHDASNNAQAKAEALRRHIRNSSDGLASLTFMINHVNEYLSRERIIFITRDGYIGTGPAGIQAGDRIALIAGIPVPLVLREMAAASGRFVVVGPAYVEGYMLGELHEKGSDLEVIILV